MFLKFIRNTLLSTKIAFKLQLFAILPGNNNYRPAGLSLRTSRTGRLRGGASVTEFNKVNILNKLATFGQGF